MGAHETIRSPLVASLVLTKKGKSFYSDKKPRDLTAYASKYGFKIQTSVCILIENANTDKPTTSKITKITIL